MKMVYKRLSGWSLGQSLPLQNFQIGEYPPPRVKNSTNEVPWTVLQIPVFRMNLNCLKQQKIGLPVTRLVEIHHSGEWNQPASSVLHDLHWKLWKINFSDSRFH